MYFTLDRNFGNGRLARAETAESSPFRTLLGEGAWQRLAEPIRARFATPPRPGRPVRYAGRFRIIRRSPLGWCLAQLCRVIGAPLPTRQGDDVPALVTVAREAGGGAGVLWHRAYRFPGGARVCTTIKRQEANALLECVGRHFGMVLRLSEEQGALTFRSVAFFCRLGGRRLAWPLWLSPGRMEVVHADAGPGDRNGQRFRFTLRVRHPWFGETFFQDGFFQALEV